MAMDPDKTIVQPTAMLRKLRWLVPALCLSLLLVLLLQWRFTHDNFRQLLAAAPYPNLKGTRSYPLVNGKRNYAHIYGPHYDSQMDVPCTSSTTSTSSAPPESDRRQQARDKNQNATWYDTRTTGSTKNANSKRKSSSVAPSTASFPGSTAEETPVLRTPSAQERGYLSLAKTKRTKFVWNVSMSSRDAHEVHHVIFVKVHKAASTTLYNVFLRFAASRQLDVMLPAYGKNLLSVFSPQLRRLLPHPASPPYRFQMLFNHVVFNSSLLRPLFPSDTLHIAIVRQPWSLVQSSYNFFKRWFPYLRTAANVTQFIAHQPEYEKRLTPLQSLTNNRMSLDMGLPPWQLDNASHVGPFVRQLDSTFDLVLVMERLPESLVLMKRMFRWSFKDIVYAKLNSKPHYTIPDYAEEQLRERFRKFQQFDCAVYDHFSSVLGENISKQSSDFAEEVKAFSDINYSVSQYCRRPSERSVLHVPATRWSAKFTVSRDECRILTAREMVVNKWLQLVQLDRLAPRIFSELR